MTLSLRASHLEAVVLDIEGTTTPLAFVQERLFPYARRALDAFVHDHFGEPDFVRVANSLRADWQDDVTRGESPPPWAQHGSADEEIASIVHYAAWLMDRDRKAFGLKELQGQIWERGYRDGDLRGDVFADVPDALRRWRDAGATIAIYSSGSVLAQQLLFRSTPFGDLTPLVDAYFDTSIGAKRDPESFRRIATALGTSAARMLFLSDVPAELAAAREAGCRAILCVRPGNVPAEDAESIVDFDAIR